jgi:hypothetical protein
MSYRREVFEKAGYFEKGFGRFCKKLLGSEEAGLSMRLLRNLPNSKIVYDPCSVVYQLFAITLYRVALGYVSASLVPRRGGESY